MGNEKAAPPPDVNHGRFIPIVYINGKFIKAQELGQELENGKGS